jgi:hypothetical protein
MFDGYTVHVSIFLNVVEVKIVLTIQSTSQCSWNLLSLCRTHATEFLSDTRIFLEEFRDVLNVLIDHGHNKVGDCPEGQVCSFAVISEAKPADATESPVAAPTFPVSAPSPISVSQPTCGEPEDGGSSISVDKACYSTGETIVASFDKISGTGIRIGIFSADLVSGLQQLPSFDGGDVKEWVLSCGAASCHTWLCTGGAQLSTANLEPGRYIAAVSGPDGSSDGQAITNFQFENC